MKEIPKIVAIASLAIIASKTAEPIILRKGENQPELAEKILFADSDFGYTVALASVSAISGTTGGTLTALHMTK